MMKPFFSRNRCRLATAALLAGAAAVLSASWVTGADAPAKADEPSNGIIATAISKPSIELQLKFAVPGVISEVAVKDGDTIKIGQVLAKQDSRQDQKQWESDNQDAISEDKMKYSEADLRSKTIDKTRKHELRDAHAASETEVEQADLAVELAAAQVKLASIEHIQKKLEADKEEIKIDQMTIYSPIDGIVEKISVGKGEMGDPQAREGAIVVGQWNPLWLEMHLPSSQAATLHMNDPISVRYEGGKWQTARIIFFEKVDAASDTQMVRMELANPNNEKVPGLHMQVQLPPALASVK